MAEHIFPHNILYDSALLHAPVRSLLEQSQINVAKNDYAGGLCYAAAAYDLTFSAPEVHASDRTARGEAAAKAALWSELGDREADYTDAWFREAFRALPLTGDPELDRESAGAALLLGRALSHRTHQSDHTATWDNTMVDAEGAFGWADAILQSHHHGLWWDRYGTMNARHRAEYQLLCGEPDRAAILAASGLLRALTAHREGRSIIGDHLPFVAKQAGKNALVIGSVLDL